MPPVFVIIAATYEELQVMLKRMPPVRRESRGGMHFFYGSMHGHDLLLVQTGVGPKKAGAAANRILKDHAPPAVLSIGAAGAADPSLHVGDIVIIKNILHYADGHFETDATRSECVAGQLSDAGMPVSRGDCFTVGAFVHTVGEKRLIFANTGARVIDMESAWLAKRFCPAGVSFLDIRIVSDTAREDIFNIEAYYAFKKKAGRAGAYIYFIKKPGEILRALRLKRNVGLVAGQIADIIEKLLL
jgi:adenosylhomocysteine nucleosidase